MKIKFIGFYTLNHLIEEYVYFNISSINLKENKKEIFKLEIQPTLYLCCLWDRRTIELSDYRADRLSSCQTLELSD